MWTGLTPALSVLIMRHKIIHTIRLLEEPKRLLQEALEYPEYLTNEIDCLIDALKCDLESCGDYK